MKILGQIVQHFSWKPGGYVPSLESLEGRHGVESKRDVTLSVRGSQGDHGLTVVELSEGKVIGDLRMVATAGDVVVGGLQSLFGTADASNHYLLRRRRFRMQKYRRGTALLLGTASSDNYYHWLLDCVPRWKILQAANRLEYDYVLLTRKLLPFQNEILDLLKVPEAKRLHCSKNFVHQFERLVVPAMPFPVEEVAPWACAWLRSLFPEKITGPEKIYLHRGTGRRRLVNETELETALSSLGFVSVQPERLPVAEQAKVLSSARCVVAPHGAALTNLIFAPPGALLVELFHPQHKNRCYVNLAKACGHRYAGLDGQPAGRDDERRLEYTIDVAAVVRLVKE